MGDSQNIRFTSLAKMKLKIGSKVKLIPGLMLEGKPATEGTIVSTKPLVAYINGKVVDIKKSQIAGVYTNH